MEKQNLPALDVIRGALQKPDFKKELALALGKDTDVNKYVRGVLTTILTTGGKLLQCSSNSICKSILKSAQLGVEVDAKEHGYLVPYYNNEKQETEATFMLGYKSYIAKAWQSNMVSAIYIEVVYAGDKFIVKKGLNPDIIHEPNLTSNQFGRDEHITFFYAIVKLKNGEFEHEIMTREQVDKVKMTAKTQVIWKGNYSEMGKKTVMRRLGKKLELPELADITAYDNQTDKSNSKLEDNPNIDVRMSDYKMSLITDIDKMQKELKLTEAAMLKAKIMYLKIDNMANATIPNLETLKQKLNGRIQQLKKKDGGKK